MFKIEKNVPMKVEKRRKYDEIPLNKMDVGDSVLIFTTEDTVSANTKLISAKNAILRKVYRDGLRSEFKVGRRKLDTNKFQVRVWRTK